MQEGEREEDELDLSNDAWLETNYLYLVQQYPRLWIAVMDQQVICDGATKREVEGKAKNIAGDREFSVYFIEPTMLPP